MAKIPALPTLAAPVGNELVVIADPADGHRTKGVAIDQLAKAAVATELQRAEDAADRAEHIAAAGYRSVKTYGEREAIPLDKREPGLLVRVLEGSTDGGRVFIWNPSLAMPGAWTGLLNEEEKMRLDLMHGGLGQDKVYGLPDTLKAMQGANAALAIVKVGGLRAELLAGTAAVITWTRDGARPVAQAVSWGSWTVPLRGDAERLDVRDWSKIDRLFVAGNSLSDITGATDQWSQLLAAALKVPLVSVARGSSDARQVYKAGASPLVLTLAGAVPASGSVAVTLINDVAPSMDSYTSPASFLNSYGGDAAPAAMSGYASDGTTSRRVTVSIARSDSVAYRIALADGGAAVTFAGPVTFTPDAALDMPRSLVGLWLGNNYYFSGVPGAFGDYTNAQLWLDLDALVRQAAGARIFMLPILPATDWTERGPGKPFDAYLAANARTRALYPQFWLTDAQGRDLVQYIQALGSDGSANDQADVAAGFTPRSCRYDGLHLNAKGVALVVSFVQAALARQALPPALTDGTAVRLVANGSNSNATAVVTAARGEAAVRGEAVDTLSGDLIKTQVIGEAAVSGGNQGAASSDSTWIFDQPVAQTGVLTELRFAMGTNAPVVAAVTVKRFTKDGSTFTLVGETVVPVKGVQSVAATIPVNAGEYIGFYTGPNGMTYSTGQTGAAEYWSAAGNVGASAAFTKQSGGAVRLMAGFTARYTVVSTARLAGIDARGAALEARATAVEGTAGFNRDALDGAARAMRSVQTVGRPQADGVTQVNVGATDNVHVYDKAMLGGGFVRTMRVALKPGLPAAGVPLLVQRWTRNGLTFTKADEKQVIGYSGVNTLAVGMAVNAGDYIGVYAGAARPLSYTFASNSGVGTGQQYHVSTAGGGNVAAFTSAGPSSADVRLELSFDVDYFPMSSAAFTAASAMASASLVKAATVETALGQLAAPVPDVIFNRPKNTSGQWTAGTFRRWRPGVLGSNLPASKTIRRWVVPCDLPAAVVAVKAMLYMRTNDANVDTVAMTGDTPLWSAEVSVAKASLTPLVDGGTYYDVTFAEPAPFVPDATKAYYLRLYAIDADGVGTVIGCGQATASPATQFERGFYNSVTGNNDGSWNAISAASGTAIALRVEADAYQVRKEALPVDVGGGAALPDLLATPIVTLTAPSALSVAVAGTMRKNGTSSVLAGSVAFPAAAAGKDRVDLIVADRLTLALSRVAGTERTALTDAVEYIPAVPAGAVLLGRVHVSETKAIAANTTLFRGLIKVGYEAELQAHVTRNMRHTRKTRGKAMRGAPIRLGGYGDSITGLQGGGVPPYTANGNSRDRIGYLGVYPADTRALVPQYDLGRGVTDNVKIGWNWAVKAALDALAGSEVVTYLNYGIGSTTSANTASANNDGKDNGLYPPRLAVPLGDALDLVVIAFGMNERNTPSTYENLVSMAQQFLAKGTEVALLGCPRPSASYAGNGTAAWRYTCDAIEAAAMDAGVAYLSTAMLADDRNLGAIGLPAEALGATNISIAGNHPGVFELAQYGRACVLQLGL